MSGPPVVSATCILSTEELHSTITAVGNAPRQQPVVWRGVDEQHLWRHLCALSQPAPATAQTQMKGLLMVLRCFGAVQR